MKDSAGFKGFFETRAFEDKNVIREMEGGDPLGVLAARKEAFIKTLKNVLPSSFEMVASSGHANTIMDAWYDSVFDTRIKGDALVVDMRVGLFGNDVVPSSTLLINTFEATLGEATGYTVDAGNSTNRSTTTFAASATQSITNSAVPSRFTFTGTDIIYGAMMIQGAPLKDGTGDTAPAVLMAAGAFSAAQPVSLASIIDVVYTQSKA